MRNIKWIIAAAAMAFVPFASPVSAQQFPGNSPVTFVVPYPPGGVSDFFARVLAPKLSESLGVPVVIDNRPGANGSIGTNAVARSKPDGHTIGLVPASTVTSNQWLMKDMPFDPMKDLTPLAITLVVPNVLVVNNDVPAKTVDELFALMKAKPGSMNFASVGVGSSSHLQGEMVKDMTKLKAEHIAYKGAGPALTDLMAGQVQWMFDNLPAVLPKLQANQLRALAVTSPKSAVQLPDVPPMNKFLPGFEATPWFGLVGPANMPKETVAKWNEHIAKAVKQPDLVKAIVDRGGEVMATSSEEMAKTMREESERMRQLITKANITIQ